MGGILAVCECVCVSSLYPCVCMSQTGRDEENKRALLAEAFICSYSRALSYSQRVSSYKTQYNLMDFRISEPRTSEAAC